jgi:ubiquinone/menaquinone biosynthesis C-methylase UbiE
MKLFIIERYRLNQLRNHQKALWRGTMNQLNLTEPAKIKAPATYNRAADHFDDVPLAYRAVTGRRTVERLGIAPDWTVLDVGCGTGASALPAAELVGPTGKVLGVDLAENLLNRARAKAEQRNLHNVEFRLGDMTALGFPDGHFDAVISVFSIFFVPNMEALIQELWRMVKPGGKLAITTWGEHIFEPVYTIWREAVRAERPDLYSAFNPWDRITLPEQVHQLLRDGGVPKAEVVPESGSQSLQSPEDWWTIVLGSGLRATVDAMDAATATRLRDHNVSWLRDNGVKSIQTNVIHAIASKDRE